jgi:hypothetical protein
VYSSYPPFFGPDSDTSPFALMKRQFSCSRFNRLGNLQSTQMGRMLRAWFESFRESAVRCLRIKRETDPCVRRLPETKESLGQIPLPSESPRHIRLPTVCTRFPSTARVCEKGGTVRRGGDQGQHHVEDESDSSRGLGLGLRRDTVADISASGWRKRWSNWGKGGTERPPFTRGIHPDIGRGRDLWMLAAMGRPRREKDAARRRRICIPGLWLRLIRVAFPRWPRTVLKPKRNYSHDRSERFININGFQDRDPWWPFMPLYRSDCPSSHLSALSGPLVDHFR